jgi:hypothetical protein
VRVLFVQESNEVDKYKAEQYLCYMLNKIGLHRQDASVYGLSEYQNFDSEIIVPMGSVVTEHVLGTLEPFDTIHGIPVQMDGRIILPMYHYSGGVSSGRVMSALQKDFKVLAQLIQGTSIDELVPVDINLNPIYQEVTDVKEAKELLSQPKFSLDTETIVEDGVSKLWSIQVSSQPGTGYFIPVSLFRRGDSVLSLDGIFQIPDTSKVIVHNYLYDARFMALPNPIDTMVMAYLLQMPMGLKELAWRLCGMKMRSYEEYTLPYRRSKALDYLHDAMCFTQSVQVLKGKKSVEKLIGYPDVHYSDWEWSNELGQLISKIHSPRNIIQKMQRLLESEDPYTDWYKIDSREREDVEQLLGQMPDTDLRDAPRDQAVYYSTRDADSTLRVALKLWPLIQEAGLMPTLKMEMGGI